MKTLPDVKALGSKPRFASNTGKAELKIQNFNKHVTNL